MTLDDIYHTLALHGIRLIIYKKPVKNINFRIKIGYCFISAPKFTNQRLVAHAIYTKLDWIVRTHDTLLKRQSTPKWHTLWGQPYHLPCDEHNILTIYRHALYDKIPSLQQKWQPIVGKEAQEVRLKKMSTRWGSCNPKEGRIWLSVYLSAYPYECTEYVFVHELCHLIHANHGAEFWNEVKKAMPDYQTWHERLKISNLATIKINDS